MDEFNELLNEVQIHYNEYLQQNEITSELSNKEE